MNRLIWQNGVQMTNGGTLHQAPVNVTPEQEEENADRLREKAVYQDHTLPFHTCIACGAGYYGTTEGLCKECDDGI